MFDPGFLHDEGDAASPEAPKAEPSRYEKALANVARSPDGLIVLRGLVAKAGLTRSVFHENAALMAFNEGQRNLGLAVLADISRVAPEAAIKILLPEDSK